MKKRVDMNRWQKNASPFSDNCCLYYATPAKQWHHFALKPEEVKHFYNQPGVVRQYSEATFRVGLWVSESIIFQRFLNKEDSLLEIGTGAGRIALGLFKIGFQNIVGIDFSRPMVREARHIARHLQCPVDFRYGDALALDFEEGQFDGIIFGFNGLMQIPKKDNRAIALAEICRVLRPGGWFIFTTHDRHFRRFKKYWKKEKALWRDDYQKEQLDEFGDRFENTPLGGLFIHVPIIEEMRAALKLSGFRIEADMTRSSLAIEPFQVRGFSDECRFWIAQKPL